MKFKQSNPKSVRPSPVPNLSTTHLTKPRARCSLCDSLLKPSTTHRYFHLAKSVHEQLDTNLTYGQCCQQYLNENYSIEKCQMFCLKCCQNLQEIYSLYKNAGELTNRIRQTWSKTKRLNRTRHLGMNHITLSSPSSSSSPINLTTDNPSIAIKEEIEHEQMPVDLKTSNNQLTPSLATQMTNGSKSKRHTTKANQFPSASKLATIQQNKTRRSQFISTSRSAVSNEQELYPKNFLYQSMNDNPLNIPYAQLMIDTPSPSSSSVSNQQQHDEQRNISSTTDQPMLTTSYDQLPDGEQSPSPHTNDDDTSSMNGSKATRLSRRQYDFLIKLPDQQSLNSFIETSAAESGSRWTWRRTSANSRGYKVYYVCNFSMRRHYHPCPAAMYALFHPEGSISIYACGQHQHIPKDRLPVSITEATKDEIFKCLQGGMSTTDIRGHLTRLQLPFGDTRKLNNFIKYHKELLRFGTVTNVRIGGTAYRQPQCWAIRRQPSTAAPNSTNEGSSIVEEEMPVWSDDH